MKSFGIRKIADVMLIHERSHVETKKPDMRVGFFLNAKVWFSDTIMIQLPDIEFSDSTMFKIIL